MHFKGFDTLENAIKQIEHSAKFRRDNSAPSIKYPDKYLMSSEEMLFSIININNKHLITGFWGFGAY